jgi:hypothetical protein
VNVMVQPGDGIELLLSGIKSAKKSIEIVIFRIDQGELCPYSFCATQPRFCIRGQAEAAITPDLNSVIVKTMKIACMIVCFILSAIA